MPAMILRMLLLSVFLLSIVPDPSHAMSSEEHRLISRNALLVSVAYAQKNNLIDGDEAARLKACFTGNDDMNYGRLSEIVDDVTDPSKFMKLYGPEADAVHGVDCAGAKAMLTSRKVTLINRLMASKYNEDHFQEKTLTKFKEFNDLAQFYALRGNLAWALVVNAFASHYLEDFFAPGHVLTPRTEVNNISARALHDILDKEGAKIGVRMSPELAGYLDVIREMKQLNGDSEQGVNALLALDGRYMITYGDGMMKNSPGQKELMIAEVAKTVTAVIRAYKTRELTRFESDYVVRINAEKKSTLLGESDYYYEEIAPRFDDVAYKPYRRDYELGRLVPIVELSPFLATPLKSGVNARWGVEADLAVYGIPRLTDESAARKFFDTFLVGAALGYDYTDEIFNATNYAHGPMLKLIFDLKNSDIGFCLYVKWRFNHENDNNFQSFPFGGRVTFSRDFFALYAGVGNEPRYTDKQENIATVYVGLTLYFPVGMTLFE
jgi:hypothetical protein